MCTMVIGIDPGMAATGYGLVSDMEDSLSCVAHGVIKTSASQKHHERLQLIHRGLKEVIDMHSPQSAAVEKLFFSKNVSTAMAVGQCRGVALLAMADRGLDVSEYTPGEIKQAVSGYGAATKLQLQQMVQMLLELDEVPRPEHAADALAVAICHAHSRKMEMLLR